MTDYIDVTAAIIQKNDTVLIAQRNTEKHQGGMWEFPGGKIEQGESPEECLKRELQEEFHVDVEIGNFFCESCYDYGIKRIRLLAYWVDGFPDKFSLNDHEEITWITIDEMDDFTFAPADVPIVEKLKERLQSKA